MARDRRRGRRDLLPWTLGGAVPPTATVLESQIVDGTILARLAANETISGDWTFSGTTTVPEATVTAHQAALSLTTAQIVSGTFADARISETSVTQHQEALSIAETQIPDGSLLARLGDNETVSGEWTFTSIQRIIQGSTIFYVLRNTAAPSGSSAWNYRVENDGSFQIRSTGDDGATTVRTVMSIIHASGSVRFQGNLRVDGTLDLNNSATVQNITPDADSAHDIGTDDMRFATGFFDAIDTAAINEAAVKAHEAALSITIGQATDWPSDAAGHLANDGAGNLSWTGAETVTGERDNPESALANLLTALATMGIIVDSTMATA